MSKRGLRRYVDDLLAGRRPASFRPDDVEADQIRTAIDLTAARSGADAPSDEFVAELHRRLAAQARPAGDSPPSGRSGSSTRRQVLVGTSAAAAAAVTAVAVDRSLVNHVGAHNNQAGSELQPADGSWQPVASSAQVTNAGMTRFEQDSLIGFLRRVDGTVQAVSGVCTHQGCQLWFDRTDDLLRCPCHTTSFAPDGKLLTHQLPIAPKPLPTFAVREVNGVVEVYGPPPGQPS